MKRKEPIVSKKAVQAEACTTARSKCFKRNPIQQDPDFSSDLDEKFPFHLTQSKEAQPSNDQPIFVGFDYDDIIVLEEEEVKKPDDDDQHDDQIITRREFKILNHKLDQLLKRPEGTSDSTESANFNSLMEGWWERFRLQKEEHKQALATLESFRATLLVDSHELHEKIENLKMMNSKIETMSTINDQLHKSFEKLVLELEQERTFIKQSFESSLLEAHQREQVMTFALQQALDHIKVMESAVKIYDPEEEQRKIINFGKELVKSSTEHIDARLEAAVERVDERLRPLIPLFQNVNRCLPPLSKDAELAMIRAHQGGGRGWTGKETGSIPTTEWRPWLKAEDAAKTTDGSADTSKPSPGEGSSKGKKKVIEDEPSPRELKKKKLDEEKIARIKKRHAVKAAKAKALQDWIFRFGVHGVRIETDPELKARFDRLKAFAWGTEEVFPLTPKESYSIENTSGSQLDMPISSRAFGYLRPFSKSENDLDIMSEGYKDQLIQFHAVLYSPQEIVWSSLKIKRLESFSKDLAFENVFYWNIFTVVRDSTVQITFTTADFPLMNPHDLVVLLKMLKPQSDDNSYPIKNVVNTFLMCYYQDLARKDLELATTISKKPEATTNMDLPPNYQSFANGEIFRDPFLGILFLSKHRAGNVVRCAFRLEEKHLHSTPTLQAIIRVAEKCPKNIDKALKKHFIDEIKWWLAVRKTMLELFPDLFPEMVPRA